MEKPQLDEQDKRELLGTSESNRSELVDYGAETERQGAGEKCWSLLWYHFPHHKPITDYPGSEP